MNHEFRGYDWNFFQKPQNKFEGSLPITQTKELCLERLYNYITDLETVVEQLALRVEELEGRPSCRNCN